MGDAGLTADQGTGEPPTPPSRGSNAGCSAGSGSSNGAALFGLVLALVGLRVRRRQR